MTTAASVPATHGELEGDDALHTLRGTGFKRLVADAAIRFRYADGFSHARALAFQAMLALLPALIAIVGLASALGQDGFARVIEDTIVQLTPEAIGDLFTAALRQGTDAAREESGEIALFAGFLAAAIAGTTAMAQVERGANRIYGIERDRPFKAKYANAFVLALTAGVLTVAAVVLLMGGSAIRQAAGWGETADDVWAIARWPLGLACSVAAVALLFERAPRRRQPEPSWLAFGAALSVVLWLAFMGVLALYIGATESFGATYGPLAGIIGMLLWTLLSAIALFAGLAFAAQLEAVRAGAPEPAVERTHNE